jgi:hypothetical protein
MKRHRPLSPATVKEVRMPPAIQVTARLATVEDVVYADVRAVHHHRRRRPSSDGHQGHLSHDSGRAEQSQTRIPIPCASEESLAAARSAFLGAGGHLDALGDWYLTRFLRANKDLKQAVKQLQKTAAWRAKVGADEIRRRVREEGMRPCEWPRCAELTPLVVYFQTELDTFVGDPMIWISFEHIFEPAKVLTVCTEAEWCAVYGIVTAQRPARCRYELRRGFAPTTEPHPPAGPPLVLAGSYSVCICAGFPV